MNSLKKLKVMFLGDESKSPEEKRLVRKLDFFILTYCCVSFFFNYLDRAAFANAYVAGLGTSLHLTGNQYNNLLSLVTAGYVIGQIPHAIIIQKVAPRIWFPSMVVVWSGLTMANAGCKTYAQLCAVRFLQGLVEASTYCGTLYVIGAWYKPLEIAKRTSIFTASGQAGTMFAGVMMTAIREGMDGYNGLEGWRWVFLIDGIITLPIAVMGFLYFPDLPETTKASYLRPDEVKIALERLPPKQEDAHNINPWSLAKRVLSSPALYILTSFAIICSALEAFCVQNLFLLWMEFNENRFHKANINTYPLGIQAVAIVTNLSAAVYIDATNRRVPVGILAGILQLVSACLLLDRNLSDAGTFFAFYNAGTSYMINPLLFGWANVICQRSGDEAVRSVILFTMNAFANVLYTFWGIALYSADDAPYWRNGCIAMIVVIFFMFGLLWVVRWLDYHTLRVTEGSSAAPEGESIKGIDKAGDPEDFPPTNEKNVQTGCAQIKSG